MKSTQMVTGQYLMITNSFKDLPKIKSSLSIQLSLNGFSFFTSSQSINSDSYELYYSSKKSEKELLEDLSDFIVKHEVLQQNFANTTVTYSDSIFSVVPSNIFEKTNAKAYLKYNVKSLSTDRIYNTNILDNEVVFSIPQIITENLEGYYNISSYNHLSAILLKHITKEYKQNIGNRVFVYSYEDFFYLLVLNGPQLQFCNTFPYETTGDFLYYLLFTFEQLGLDPAKETLYLLNTLHEETIRFLEPYIYDIKVPAFTSKNFVHLANLQS